MSFLLFTLCLLVAGSHLSSALERRQLSGVEATENGIDYRCKCYEGDSCWPSKESWDSLNATVHGNLLLALPPASVCYNSVDGVETYDEAVCAFLQDQWAVNQTWHVETSVGNLWTYWTNDTCLPTTDPSASCTKGYYPDYVIMAKSKEHVKAGVDFARENDIRLIIRNTGHDFMGRSIGFGALAINTHGFKDVEFVENYSGPGGWDGGAVKIGAGVQAAELYALAFEQTPPVVVVGGECPTVGLAGGYIQGGGHGPMATFYGMAADNALSFDVVTAQGDFITANEAQNPDLFWALKGGGPGDFAVILSVTFKTHPEVHSAGVVLDINSTMTDDPDLIWTGMAAFHRLSNYFVENGMFVYWELSEFGPLSLHIKPFVGPNMTAAEIDEVLKPLFDELDEAGVPYATETREFNTFYELYVALFDPEDAAQSAMLGSRLITYRDIDEHSPEIVDAYKTALENGALVVGHVVGPGQARPEVDNAVHPAWRNASSFSIFTTLVPGNTSLEGKRAEQDVITNVIGSAFRDAAPNGATYVNEGDLEEPNWQESYWGSNYQRLYDLKQIWDPEGVFYTRLTPGSEDWDVIDFNTKLCKKI